MPLEKIVIRVAGETDLASTISQLEKVGVVDKKNADSFKATSATAKKSFSDIDQAANSTKTNMGGLGSAIDKIGPAMLAAFSITAIVAAGKEIITLTAKYDSLNKAIKFGSGSTFEAEKNFNFLKQTAEDLGLDLLVLTENFKGFSIGAMKAGISAEETRKIFGKVAGAASAMGLSAQDTNGVFLALTQIISKGTVQAEELRGQIGERIPGAFNIAADAMGVTTKQLNKMLEQGQVLSSEFLPKFANELDKTFKGALPEATDSLQSNINRLGTAFDGLWVSIGDTGSGVIVGFIKLLTQFTTSLGETIKFISNPAKYAREAAKMEYSKAVEDYKKFYGDITSFDAEIEAIKIKNIVDSNKNLSEKELTAYRARYDALATLIYENNEAEKKALEGAGKNKVGLIKALSDELRGLKKQEEEALTEVEIRAIQVREAEVVAELDRLYGRKNKKLEEQLKKEKQILDDAEADYHSMVKNQADNDAYEREELSKKRIKLDKEEKENLEKSDKEYHDYVKGLAEDQAKEDARRSAEKIANQKAIQQFVSSSLSQIASQLNANIQARGQTEIAAIQNTEDAELEALDRRALAENLTAAQIARERKKIQDKAHREEKAIKKKTAQQEKELALFQIAVNTAVAVVKALPNYPLVALALATGAVEAALVSSRPIPEYAKGTENAAGGLSLVGERGPEYVNIPKGSQVFTANASSKHSDAIKALNKGTFDDYVYKKYVTPAIISDSISDARSKGMAHNIAASIRTQDFDTHNLEQAIKGNKKVKIENLGDLAAIIQRSDHFGKYKF